MEVALIEAEVLGLRLGPMDAWCDLLLHVPALPETGPIDPDPRRILRLTPPAEVKVVLRPDRPGSAGHGTVIPLADLDATEDFFASLTWFGPMYGWKFLDDPSLTQDWPAQPSLIATTGSGTGSHSLYWFSECGRETAAEYAAYCIEGTVIFEDLEILRADAAPQPLKEFAADARRYWEALYSHDPRLSVEAQGVAQNGALTWRPRGGTTSTTGTLRQRRAVRVPGRP